MCCTRQSGEFILQTNYGEYLESIRGRAFFINDFFRTRSRIFSAYSKIALVCLWNHLKILEGQMSTEKEMFENGCFRIREYFESIFRRGKHSGYFGKNSVH